MQGISGFQYDDPINLVTKLFLVYREVKNNDESFDNFYFWGEVMLADFDQIDKYMVDAQSLFSNIKDIKDIEERFGGLSPEQSEALSEYLGIVMDDSQPSDIKANYLVFGINWALYTANSNLNFSNRAFLRGDGLPNGCRKIHMANYSSC